MRYTTILHEPRLMLGLSMNEYCLADIIYHYCNNPKNPVPGWCFSSKQHLADVIGITKSWAIKSITLLEEKGIIVKSGDGRMLKTTDKWYSNVVLKKDFTDGVESTPVSVNKVHRDGVENTPPSYNNTYNDNLKESSLPKGNVTKQPELEIIKEKTVREKCIAIWAEAYPDLMASFDGLQGKKMNSILKKITAYCKTSGMEGTDGQVLASFEKLVKSMPEWYKGKDLSIIDSKFGSIIHEIKHGRKKDDFHSQNSANRAFSKYSNP